MDSMEARPFTAASYQAPSRPGTTSQALSDFLWTEDEYDAGHATRPTTSQRSGTASSATSSRPQTQPQQPAAELDSPEKASREDT
jgi:hypothetical protein